MKLVADTNSMSLGPPTASSAPGREEADEAVGGPGESYSLTFKEKPKSPFDIPGITTGATTPDILAAVGESRSREA